MQAPRVDYFANIRRLVQAPVQHMRTYALAQPLATHFRRATCAEVECPNWAHGWKMGFDLRDDDRRAAARDIRDKSGRRFTAEVTGDGAKVIFTFPAGQDCFARHRVPLERDPIMIVRHGDFRGNPTGVRTQERDPEIFLERWAGDLDKIKTVHDRG